MKKKNVTIEDLAGMVQRGFSTINTEMGERFEAVDKHFTAVDKQLVGMNTRLDHMDARLGRIEADVSELRGEIVHRQEFEDALARIKYLEKKLDIKSGAD